MKKPVRLLTALCTAFLLAVPLGCSPDAPTAPAPVQPQASLIGGLLGGVTDVVGGVTDVVGGVTDVVDGVVRTAGGVLDALLDPLICPTDREYSTTRIVGRSGGTINVGPHRLVVPAGALTRETRITATAPRGSYAEVEFQPHGLKFRTPVTLTMSYAECGLLNSSKPPVIVYADDDRTILEVLKTSIDRSRETITGKTDHFSSYMVAE
jgi:hypothetical protein